VGRPPWRLGGSSAGRPNGKTRVFPAKYKRHLNSALGGALHLTKVACFHDPFALKDTQKARKQNRITSATNMTNK
jgi:hypothetical protein